MWDRHSCLSPLLQSPMQVFAGEKRGVQPSGRHATLFVGEHCWREFRQGDRQECLSHIAPLAERGFRRQHHSSGMSIARTGSRAALQSALVLGLCAFLRAPGLHGAFRIMTFAHTARLVAAAVVAAIVFRIPVARAIYGWPGTLFVVAAIVVAALLVLFAWTKPASPEGHRVRTLLLIPSLPFIAGMLAEAAAGGGHPSIGALLWPISGQIALIVSPFAIASMLKSTRHDERRAFLSVAIGLLFVILVALVAPLPLWPH